MSTTIKPHQRRPLWRRVAVPAERGGWGLTAEPILLGLVVAPSVAGALLGFVAAAAFLARAPLRLAVLDTRRHRHEPRTVLAWRIAAAELIVLLAALAGAFVLSGRLWWVPLVGALPLVGVDLYFDLRSKGRRQLLPELVGALGIAAIAPAIALAGGSSGGLAVGLWIVLAARSTTSVPCVRALILRLHRGEPGRAPWVWTLAACLGTGAGRAAGWVPWLGVVAICLLAAYNLVTLARTASSAKRVGIGQAVAGLGVVAITALGVVLGA